jgi:NTE family protein
VSSQPFTKPDVLVLAAGGILGEAWMTAVLAGIEHASGVDFRRTESLVGTSAGSIVAGALSAGRRPSAARGAGARGEAGGATGRQETRDPRPRRGSRPRADDTFARAAGGSSATGRPGHARELEAAAGSDSDGESGPARDLEGAGGSDAAGSQVETRHRGAAEAWRDAVRSRAQRGLSSAAWAIGAPLAPVALAVGATGGALLRSLLLARAPEGTRTLGRVVEEFDRGGARFDGRLRVCCVDRASGRRVVFGAPGAPGAQVGEAVAASCAIPTVFRPVRIGGREYVDGGVWSLTNLDAAAVASGTRVLCLNPTGNLPVEPASAFGAVRAAFRAAEALEAAVLRRRGALVRIIAPDGNAANAMGVNLMQPGPRARVARAGYAQGLRIGGG